MFNSNIILPTVNNFDIKQKMALNISFTIISDEIKFWISLS